MAVVSTLQECFFGGVVFKVARKSVFREHDVKDLGIVLERWIFSAWNLEVFINIIVAYLREYVHT